MNKVIINEVPYCVDGVVDVLGSRLAFKEGANIPPEKEGGGPKGPSSPPSYYKYFEPAVEIAEGVNFANDYWDFHKVRRAKDHPVDLRYNFTKIKTPAYKFYAKKYVLIHLFQRENDFSYTKNLFYTLLVFLRNLENEIRITVPAAILDGHVKKFLESSISLNLKEKRKAVIKDFFLLFENWEDNFKPNEYRSVFGTVVQAEKSKRKKVKQENKTPNIPNSLFDSIISHAIKDMEEEKLDLMHRMTAAAIVLLSQIGMRLGELTLLQPGKLASKPVLKDTKNAYFLEFWTYKTTKEKDGHWTITFMTPQAVKAYKILEEIGASRREKRREKINQKNDPPTEEELIEFLMPNPHGERYSNRGWDYNLNLFFIRHQNTLGFEKLTESQIKKVGVQRVTKTLAKNCRIFSEQDKGKTFYKIRSHQFRVAVCNYLRKQVEFKWVKKHMNHLLDEMTKHYFREDDEILEETIKARVSKNGDRLETNLENITDLNIRKELSEPEMRKAYEAINEFLQENNLEIYRDLSEILDIFSNTPVLDMDSNLGFCTNAMELLCERQAKLNKKWTYYRPQVPFVHELDSTYKNVLEKLILVKHNKKIAEKDNIYVREYELQLRGLKNYCEGKFFPELKMLQQVLEEGGHEKVISHNPHLELLLFKLDELERVEMECREWIETMKLVESS